MSLRTTMDIQYTWILWQGKIVANLDCWTVLFSKRRGWRMSYFSPLQVSLYQSTWKSGVRSSNNKSTFSPYYSELLLYFSEAQAVYASRLWLKLNCQFIHLFNTNSCLVLTKDIFLTVYNLVLRVKESLILPIKAEQ